jgi:hypothetical protein
VIAKLHVKRREKYLAAASRVREVVENPNQSFQDTLVICNWRWAHDQLSVDDLVALTVVRHLYEVVVGEGAQGRDHRVLLGTGRVAQSATAVSR